MVFLSRLLLGLDVLAVRRRLNELILDGGHRVLGIRREDPAVGRSRIVPGRCGARRLGRRFIGDRLGLITKRIARTSWRDRHGLFIFTTDRKSSCGSYRIDQTSMSR